MKSAVIISHRKLIDLRSSVFETLSMDAGRQNVSLKKYIENMLDERARVLDEQPRNLNVSPAIFRLIGSAKPASGKIEEIEDDRLMYLLSK